MGRDFEGGKRTFAAARCVVCHRFGDDGGSTGPDLTQAGGRLAPGQPPPQGPEWVRAATASKYAP